MRKLRVTHLISGLFVGGAEMMLWRLLSRIDRDRFDSEVICLMESGPMADRIRDLDVPVTILGMRSGRPSVGGFFRLTRELRRFRPDVLQTWLYHADLAGLLAGEATRIPAIVWNIRASDMDLSHYRKLTTLTLRACARWSHVPAAVVVNSEAGRRHHETLGYRPRRWVSIPNGVDTSQFRPDGDARLSVRQELGIPADAIVVGLIGRFDPMKDHAGFLRAAAMVARTHADVRFVLAGKDVDSDNPALRQAVEHGSLQERVHLLGARSDVPRITASLDLAVSSSSSEGFSNVLVEAMSSGVSAVATDVGDSRQIVAETGEIVPPSDSHALAAAIERAIRLDPNARTERGRRARARVLAEYDLPIAVARYEHLYSSLQEADACAA